MPIRDLQKLMKIFLGIGTPFDRKKIYDLNEKFGVATASFAHGLNQLFQSRQKSIVADAQQRPAGNVAHAGSFDDERRGLSFGKSSIPIEVVLGDETVFGRAPRHHRRHPRAALKRDRTNPNWPKKKRAARFCHRGPMRFRNRMLDGIRELPHERNTLAWSLRNSAVSACL